MEINRKNYEAYFIDYLEGNLDENMVDEFIEFLQQNPDLKEELNSIGTLVLTQEQTVFDGKEKLYKERYDLLREFENAAVAMLEGDINESEANEINEYLEKNPAKKKEWELFQKTKLSADLSIMYTDKNKLYNSTSTKKFFIWVSRFAATILILFILSILLGKYNEIIPPEPLMVEANIQKTKKVIPLNEIGEKKTRKKKLVKPLDTEEKEDKPKKSIRETGRGRLHEEKTSDVLRDTLVYPSLALRKVDFVTDKPFATLANMDHLISPSISVEEEYPDDIFLADRLKEKTGINDFKFNKITKAGLNFASTISKNKVSYHTNNEGEITALALDTRLLGFSIPLNK